MKILICIDSFKGSLTSLEASNAIIEGLSDYKDIDTIVIPISDGGEGMLEAYQNFVKCTSYNYEICSATKNKINAKYLITKDNIAIIEVAKIIGLPLLKNEERNPLFTTTYGIGELIEYIINKHNIKEFIIGLGGSSTNDGGSGMLVAMGAELLDNNNSPIPLGAKGLKDLVSINIQNLSKYKDIHFLIASDVDNPLLGINGSSYVYAKQKGATLKDVKNMESYLSHFAHLTKNVTNTNNIDLKGAGAAGGLGFAFSSYFNSNIVSGIDLLIAKSNLENIIKTVDLIITGEGKIDYQSINGKAPFGISKLAKKYNKKVIALCGKLELDKETYQKYGIDECYEINDCCSNDNLNYEVAYKNLKNKTIKIFNKKVINK